MYTSSNNQKSVLKLYFFSSSFSSKRGVFSGSLCSGNCSQGLCRSNLRNSCAISIGSETTRFSSSSQRTLEKKHKWQNLLERTKIKTGDTYQRLVQAILPHLVLQRSNNNNTISGVLNPVSIIGFSGRIGAPRQLRIFLVSQRIVTSYIVV